MPAPLLIAAVAAQVGGAVWNAASAKKAGDKARKIGDFNARVAELQATDALARGTQDAQQIRSYGRGLIGTQRAGYAGQNVNVNSGSAVDVQADTAYAAEQDAQRRIANAEREAWGYRIDAENARLGGQSAQGAAYAQAAGSLLGTGSSLALAAYGWQKPAPTFNTGYANAPFYMSSRS